MFRELAKLVIYRNLDDGCILYPLGEVFREFERLQKGNSGGDECQFSYNIDMIGQIHVQINRLLDIATHYGFDDNLWCNYLAYILISNENSFTITCERTKIREGSVYHFVKQDLEVFYHLIHFDFKPIEEILNIDCFTTIKHYQSLVKPERSYNKNMSEKVKILGKSIQSAADAQELFHIVTQFYHKYGIGKFGMNMAFRIISENGETGIVPILNTGTVDIDELIGYDRQKKQLLDNTEAFVEGRKANNVLLYGDSGTGKSTCIKAIMSKYYEKGLRIIEIYKHQFQELSSVIDCIKNRNYRFIIYMDDLSFEEFETEYKYLKAIIEGGLETKPENILIYATSNRRHLIRETWRDRSDISSDELHHSDTMQEKLSLVARFGVTIHFSKPSQKEFFHMVIELAKRNPKLKLSEEELISQANKWSMRNGGLSGRTAAQFIVNLESNLLES